MPSIADALQRLAYLKALCPTAHAFTFRTPFPAPDAESTDLAGLDARFCEWAT